MPRINKKRRHMQTAIELVFLECLPHIYLRYYSRAMLFENACALCKGFVTMTLGKGCKRGNGIDIVFGSLVTSLSTSITGFWIRDIENPIFSSSPSVGILDLLWLPLDFLSLSKSEELEYHPKADRKGNKSTSILHSRGWCNESRWRWPGWTHHMW